MNIAPLPFNICVHDITRSQFDADDVFEANWVVSDLPEHIVRYDYIEWCSEVNIPVATDKTFTKLLFADEGSAIIFAVAWS